MPSPDRDVPVGDTLRSGSGEVAPRVSSMDGTPQGTDLLRLDGAERTAVLLEQLVGTARRGRDGALRIEQTLGEGGMGLVRAATQVAIGRKVAIKSLRPSCRSAAARLELLREAWVTASLAHPNVIPIYEIMTDDEGWPLIVMQRVEGVNCAALLEDEERARECSHGQDLLRWHLSVVVQVCHAVQHAHRAGIIHRDIKPRNVMIGPSGEVYLLDWGLAVALNDEWAGCVPSACDATGLDGTPEYMAPEMWGGVPDRLSVRTDVYLLGAVLFEIVSGRPPHPRQGRAEILKSLLEAAEPAPLGAPPELEQICRRAMSVHPAERYESAEAFRCAVEDFLQYSCFSRGGVSSLTAEEVPVSAVTFHSGKREQDLSPSSACRQVGTAAMKPHVRSWGATPRGRARSL